MQIKYYSFSVNIQQIVVKSEQKYSQSKKNIIPYQEDGGKLILFMEMENF